MPKSRDLGSYGNAEVGRVAHPALIGMRGVSITATADAIVAFIRYSRRRLVAGHAR